MRDLWTALALVLVIEGALYALFPDGMKRAAVRALSIPPQTLRLAGPAPACPRDVLFWPGRRGCRRRHPQHAWPAGGFSPSLGRPPAEDAAHGRQKLILPVPPE